MATFFADVLDATERVPPVLQRAVKQRFIQRGSIFDAVDTFEVIEAYPDDKYLPSYLVYGQCKGTVFHVLFGVDAQDRNVRVVTAYRPDESEWEVDLKRRRRKQ